MSMDRTGESVGLMDDLLTYANQENLGGVMFAAEMEKAFDFVEHNIIFATLRKSDFGNSFIKWVRTFFNSLRHRTNPRHSCIWSV